MLGFILYNVYLIHCCYCIEMILDNVGQRILANFFVLYDAFLDASLFTVRAFLTMIRECIAVRARSFSASATTGHIWRPVYHNLHKGDRQVVGRHTGREASLPPHTCTPHGTRYRVRSASIAGIRAQWVIPSSCTLRLVVAFRILTEFVYSRSYRAPALCDQWSHSAL